MSMPGRDAAQGSGGETSDACEARDQREFQIAYQRAQELARRMAWSHYGYALRCPMNHPLRLVERPLPAAVTPRSSGLAVTLDLLSRFAIGARFRTH